MADNELKKMIIFSDIGTKRVVEGILKDRKEADHISYSEQIERSLMDGLLPENEMAREQIVQMYTNDLPLNQALANVFSVLSAGGDGRPLQNNLLKLVFFCSDLTLFANKDFEKDSADYSVFLALFHRIMPVLEKELKDSGDYRKEGALDYAQWLLTEAETNKERFWFHDVWGSVILGSWNVLCDEAATYDLMAQMIRMEKKLTNSAEARVKFVKILTQVSDEWT